MYIAATTPFAVLALITFALRLYTRIGSSTLFRWDDAFMAAAMVS